jgi:hypothetical protein
VDYGYRNQIGYLAPFKGTTYHIPEFCHHRGRPLQGKHEIFNFLHSSLHNVIERAFGVLKQKWHILKAMLSFSARRHAQIIIVCFALHNFIRESQLHDKMFERCVVDDGYMPGASNNEDVTEDVDEEEGGNEVTMNTICDRIAIALANARAT